MNFSLRYMLLMFFLPGLFISCGQSPKSPESASEEFAVKDFIPATNWKQGETLFLDYAGAMAHGFVIPGIRQVEGGFFTLEFKLKNTGTRPQKFAYKIYYQNESYKFPERDGVDTTKQHEHAWENFYGSWEDTGITFAETGIIEPDREFHTVNGKFRIVGNPRNEQRYFEKGQNDRWKRNPRVGNYSFMLVVTTAANLQEKRIPEAVQDIGMNSAGGFVDPLFLFSLRTRKIIEKHHYPEIPRDADRRGQTRSRGRNIHQPQCLFEGGDRKGKSRRLRAGFIRLQNGCL